MLGMMEAILFACGDPIDIDKLAQALNTEEENVLELSQKALIEERGRLDLPGKPLLYGTTENFLRCMGIRSLLELPPLPQEEETENAPQNDGADKA